MARDRFDALYALVGDRLCKARVAARLSQAQLAKKVGINRVSVVNIEKGRQRAPLDLLWQLGEALGVELVQLMPRTRDFAAVADGVELGADDVKAIRNATKGDVAAARQITDFVQRAKARTEPPT
jgi:transcriptional regulator with XRE-family HTH domain